MQGTTLVLGGTGTTGRRVAARLRARSAAVRIGSRAGDPRFDWEDRATWGPVVEGVDAAYVCFVPDLAVPGAAETVAAFAETATAAGVRRLVLLSGRGEDGALQAERAVRDAAAALTVVRASWFSQNFSEGLLRDGVLSGELALPAGEVPEPFVDVEDIADVAVAALTDAGHEGEVYEVSGPRALTFAEAMAEISRASGRPVAFRSIPLDDFAAGLAAAGQPPEVVGLIAYLFSEVLDGRNAEPADGVMRALGRPARDFSDYARAAAAAGAWDPVGARR